MKRSQAVADSLARKEHVFNGGFDSELVSPVSTTVEDPMLTASHAEILSVVTTL